MFQIAFPSSRELSLTKEFPINPCTINLTLTALWILSSFPFVHTVIEFENHWLSVEMIFIIPFLYLSRMVGSAL